MASAALNGAIERQRLLRAGARRDAAAQDEDHEADVSGHRPRDSGRSRLVTRLELKRAPASVTKSDNVHLSRGEIDCAVYAALVRAAAEGDREAMERLLMRAQEVAYRFSLLVCGHPQDAEDVMQDALLKTYRYVNRIKSPRRFGPGCIRRCRTPA